MKKLNNKILVGVLIGLAAIFVLSKVFRSSRLQSNMKAQLVQIDTAVVTKLTLDADAANGKQIELIRDQKKWIAKMDNRTAPTEQGAVSNALASLVQMKPLRLVTRKKEKWQEYSVADTNTHVKIWGGEELLADVHIGRIGYNQSSDGQFNPGSVFSYVRLANEDEVYAVEGFLQSTYNRSFDDWRDKAFLRLKKDMITEVRFDYPADSSFTISKKDKRWWINNEAADSLKVNSFLSQLEYKNAAAFADEFTNTAKGDFTISIQGSSGVLATVSAWKRPTDWVLQSSWQPSIHFSSDNTGLAKSLFEPRKNFLLKK